MILGMISQLALFRRPTSLARAIQRLFGAPLILISLTRIRTNEVNIITSNLTFITVLLLVRPDLILKFLLTPVASDTSYIRSILFIKNIGNTVERVRLYGDWRTNDFAIDRSPVNGGRYYTL